MDWLEEELKQALARKEPAADFDARVRRRTVRTAPRWLAAAAAVIVLAGGAGMYRRHQGEQAKEQLMQAMRITGEKLNQVQGHVQAMGERQ
jgi:hypothetical protein